MKKAYRSSILLLALTLLVGIAEGNKGYSPDDARMTWWREARFGMFIHWGLYSIPAGEWKGETNHAEWIRTTAQIPNEMQGESLRALAQIGQPEDWRKAMYYHYYEYPHGWHFVKRHYGVRTDQYKLIHFYEDIDEWEFYDLKVDPNEINNIFGNPAYAEIIENSRQQLLELRQEVGDTNSVMTK